MNRNEILEKSKQENTIIDERGKYIKLKSADFSCIITIIIGSFLASIYKSENLPYQGIYFLIWASILSAYIYQYIRTKSKNSLFFSIVLSIAVCVIGYNFYMEWM